VIGGSQTYTKLHGKSDRGALSVRGNRLVWGERTYLMGIVNVSPDSFSGDGTPTVPAATERARLQLSAGADIVDIGAESTRPGHTPIDARTEKARLLPVLERVRAELPSDTILSVDTFKAEVFRAAHRLGADMLNSIWGLDDELRATAAELGVPVVIMHNKAVAVYEGDVVDEVLRELDAAASRAVAAGIPQQHVIVDPGIGFGKLPEHNLALLAALDRIVALGFPTLLGPSRKSTIGKLTGRSVDARVFGTAGVVALAAAAGIDIVRIHDVAEMRDVVRVSDAIARGWRPEDWRETLP
jgi:dihydropteroate synthase